MGMDMDFNQIALPRYFLFLCHMGMDKDCKQVVVPRYFLYLSDMDMDCNQIALPEKVFFWQLCVIPLNLALFRTWVGWQNTCHLQHIPRCKDWLLTASQLPTRSF
jgi:hypothetical protein